MPLSGPCLCGACDCPSCGPAQGYTLHRIWKNGRYRFVTEEDLPEGYIPPPDEPDEPYYERDYPLDTPT